MSRYVVVVDKDRRYVEVTDAVCELLGYTREQMLAMRIDDISAPSGAHTSVMFDKFVNDGKMRGFYLLKHRNGREVYVDFVAEALPDGRYRAEWTPNPAHTRRERRLEERT